LFRDIDKNSVKKLKKDFENINGNKIKDFSIKEIVLMFHKNTKENIELCNKSIIQLDKKLDSRIEWGQKTLSEHDIIIQKITDQLEHIATELPEKGFCEKTTNTLFPSPPELPLDQKVDLLWHDRRWIKKLLYIAITLISALSGTNIAISVFT